MSDLPLMRGSERKDFKECQAKWHWAWNEGWYVEKGSGALWFGTGIHLALAEWYTPPAAKDGFVRGRHPVETWREYCKDAFEVVRLGEYFGPEDEKEFIDAEELGALMLQGYLDKWGTDPQWEVLMPEQRFREKIPYTKRQQEMYGWESFDRIVEMVGTFDMPIRNHSYDHKSKIEIVDHKSSGRAESSDWLTKDDQSGLYIATSTAALRRLGLIKPDEAVTGAIWNYLRKAKPKDEEMRDDQGRITNKPQIRHYQTAFVNAPGSSFGPEDFKGWKIADYEVLAKETGLKVYGDVSKNQGVPLFWRVQVQRSKANRLRQIQRIAEDAEVMARVRSGELPILKSPAEHCNWCQFKDLCDIDEDGGDAEDFAKNVFLKRDPYADHRVGAGNSKSSLVASKDQK